MRDKDSCGTIRIGDSRTMSRYWNTRVVGFSLCSAVLAGLFGAGALADGQAPAQAGASGTYPRTSLRLPDMPLHDPWMLAHRPSRTYYLYTSNIARMTGVTRTGTMVYKSSGRKGGRARTRRAASTSGPRTRCSARSTGRRWPTIAHSAGLTRILVIARMASCQRRCRFPK